MNDNKADILKQFNNTEQYAKIIYEDRNEYRTSDVLLSKEYTSPEISPDNSNKRKYDDYLKCYPSGASEELIPGTYLEERDELLYDDESPMVP